MRRRKFLRAAGLAALAAPVARAEQAVGKDAAKIRWRMVTAWPKNYPGTGTAANRLAALIRDMSNGRLDIKVFGAGELVPAFEVFDAVSSGTAEMGHAASHYWAGKLPAAAFFSGVPFGMTANETNAWLYYGGGLDLWRELYRPFGLIPMPAGNGGVQMAGWYRKPIHGMDDFQGLKIRMAGLAGEVLRKAGAVPVLMPLGEVFQALDSGALDAAEFAGPFPDAPLGLYKAAKYYYAPGWNEPASPIECVVNRKTFEALPSDLQSIVTTACRAMNNDFLAEFTAANARALEMLASKHQVKLSNLPTAVIDALRDITKQVLADYIVKDAMARRIYSEYQEFAKTIGVWTAVSEKAYLAAR
jgi:TRAP-type mannitol/chloroaromatic compound transport system substrate-binding protein